MMLRLLTHCLTTMIYQAEARTDQRRGHSLMLLETKPELITSGPLRRVSIEAAEVYR